MLPSQKIYAKYFRQIEINHNLSGEIERENIFSEKSYLGGGNLSFLQFTFLHWIKLLPKVCQINLKKMIIL